MPSFIQIGEGYKAGSSITGGCALWNLGFRPFYLFAAIFAAIAIAVWVAHFSGMLAFGTYLRDPLWHAHEMIFGYAFAIVVGFLFTAVRNWSGKPTPSGKVLLLIVALWLEARVLLLLALPIPALYFDLAFAIAAAFGIAMPLKAGGNRRNYFFVLLLLAIGIANGAFSLAIVGAIAVSPRQMLGVALDLVLIIMVVMGGRVIPMFTASALPQSRPKRPPLLEMLAIVSVVMLLAADVLAVPAPLIGCVAALAAMAHGARLLLWQPWHTVRRPILWILHLAYAWIVVHLALRSVAAWVPGVSSLATHALTVGGIGGLTLGMMTRTARGHTGRPLVAEKGEVTIYMLIQVASVVRVFLPLAAPQMLMAAVGWSGALWVAAFVIFVVKYAPFLWRPRLDGKSA